MNASRENSRDFEWLSDPDKNWVHWPMCPVKRFADSFGAKVPDAPECGIVWRGELTCVYIQNLFMLVSGPVKAQLAGCKKYEYESIQEMLADGWRVD